jgi:glyoxylase-like metal-dependent hydrolase (beta-lactamase superfamily II)
MQKNNAPAAAQPQYTFYSPRRKWDWFNGEGIELHHIPAAHTDGDTMVYFRYSDVIVAGDIYRSDSYPVIDVENGGSFEGMVNGLNKILDMSMNMWREQGGTYIVPGHGYIADETDVSIYRQMVLKIRDRVQSMVSKGMTLEQVKAARPTLDFDGRYGSPDRFIEVLYRTFSRR